MQLSTVFIQLLNGVQYGMLLFLIASGLTLTFGVMGIINLAHGAFFMIGAYLAFSLLGTAPVSTPVFFGAALLGFEDFLAESVDMSLGSVGSRRQNRRSHDPKPRTSRGEP